MTPALSRAPHLVVLYGAGGLSDVGRHAILAALERDDIPKITVLTKYPELLKETNWNCACPGGHDGSSLLTNERVTIITLDDYANMAPHFAGATAVVSCLGNRQPFFGHVDAFEGTRHVIKAITTHNISRLVCMSSVGIHDDWPAMEWHWSRWIMSAMLLSIARPAYKDLSQMEDAVRANKDHCDYLLVRPVGIGEDIAPVNQWYLQKKKWEDKPYFNMAKLDVARYMVEEAIQPTRHKDAVVIGGKPQ